MYMQAYAWLSAFRRTDESLMIVVIAAASLMIWFVPVLVFTYVAKREKTPKRIGRRVWTFLLLLCPFSAVVYFSWILSRATDLSSLGVVAPLLFLAGSIGVAASVARPTRWVRRSFGGVLLVSVLMVLGLGSQHASSRVHRAVESLQAQQLPLALPSIGGSADSAFETDDIYWFGRSVPTVVVRHSNGVEFDLSFDGNSDWQCGNECEEIGTLDDGTSVVIQQGVAAVAVRPEGRWILQGSVNWSVLPTVPTDDIVELFNSLEPVDAAEFIERAELGP